MSLPGTAAALGVGLFFLSSHLPALAAGPDELEQVKSQLAELRVQLRGAPAGAREADRGTAAGRGVGAVECGRCDRGFARGAGAPGCGRGDRSFTGSALRRLHSIRRSR